MRLIEDEEAQAFTEDVLGIMSSFRTNNDEKIEQILKAIDKYKNIKIDFGAFMGLFS